MPHLAYVDLPKAMVIMSLGILKYSIVLARATVWGCKIIKSSTWTGKKKIFVNFFRIYKRTVRLFLHNFKFAGNPHVVSVRRSPVRYIIFSYLFFGKRLYHFFSRAIFFIHLSGLTNLDSPLMLLWTIYFDYNFIFLKLIYCLRLNVNFVSKIFRLVQNLSSL